MDDTAVRQPQLGIEIGNGLSISQTGIEGNGGHQVAFDGTLVALLFDSDLSAIQSEERTSDDVVVGEHNAVGELQPTANPTDEPVDLTAMSAAVGDEAQHGSQGNDQFSAYRTTNAKLLIGAFNNLTCQTLATGQEQLSVLWLYWR